MRAAGVSSRHGVVCVRVSSVPDFQVPGSVRRDCAGCADPIWVSPNAVALARMESAPFVCVRCAFGIREVRQ